MKTGVIGRVERGIYVRNGETVAKTATKTVAKTPAPKQDKKEAVTAGSPNVEWSK